MQHRGVYSMHTQRVLRGWTQSERFRSLLLPLGVPGPRRGVDPDLHADERAVQVRRDAGHLRHAVGARVRVG